MPGAWMVRVTFPPDTLLAATSLMMIETLLVPCIWARLKPGQQSTQVEISIARARRYPDLFIVFNTQILGDGG